MPQQDNANPRERKVTITTTDDGIGVKIISKTTFADHFRAWAPIVVSIMALITTVYQLQKLRDNYRVQVEPHLWFYFQDSPYVPRFGLWIENNGLGPAIIDSLVFYVDEKRIPTDDMSKSWMLIEQQLKVGGVEVTPQYWSKIYKEWWIPGYALQRSSEAVFFAIPDAFVVSGEEVLSHRDSVSIGLNEEVLKVLLHMDIAIYYRSFFGDTASVWFENEKLK
jgi:hypothetical protein